MAMPALMIMTTMSNQRTYGGGYGLGPPNRGEAWTFYLLMAAIVLIPILVTLAIFLL